MLKIKRSETIEKVIFLFLSSAHHELIFKGRRLHKSEFSKLKGPSCLQVLEKPRTEATFNTFTYAILHYGLAFIVRTKYFHYIFCMKLNCNISIIHIIYDYIWSDAMGYGIDALMHCCIWTNQQHDILSIQSLQSTKNEKRSWVL